MSCPRTALCKSEKYIREPDPIPPGNRYAAGELWAPPPCPTAHFSFLRRARQQIVSKAHDQEKGMRWNRWTVQPFLDVRTAVLNGTLQGSFKRRYPAFRIGNDNHFAQLAARDTPRSCMLSRRDRAYFSHDEHFDDRRRRRRHRKITDEAVLAWTTYRSAARSLCMIEAASDLETWVAHRRQAHRRRSSFLLAPGIIAGLFCPAAQPSDPHGPVRALCGKTGASRSPSDRRLPLAASFIDHRTPSWP